jgi:hypothetical protein
VNPFSPQTPAAWCKESRSLVALADRVQHLRQKFNRRFRIQPVPSDSEKIRRRWGVTFTQLPQIFGKFVRNDSPQPEQTNGFLFSASADWAAVTDRTRGWPLPHLMPFIFTPTFFSA